MKNKVVKNKEVDMHKFYDAGTYVLKYEDSHFDFSVNRSNALINYITNKNRHISSWLDLACGTGALLKIVQEKLNLNKCVGLDISKKMLAYAKNMVKHKNIKFVYGDMTDFDLNDKFDMITCNYNAINELNGLDNWLKLFELAFKHLNKGGFFSFDINTLLKLKGGSKTFYTSTDKYDVVSKFIPHKDNSVDYVTITYDKSKDGTYIKEEIQMTEYSYEVSKIKKLLKSVGFKNIIVGNSNFNKCKLNNERRLFFICEK